MDRLSSVLPRVLHRRGFSEQAQAAMITFKARAWLQESHPHLADLVQVRIFKEGELVVACSHSIALQEVQGQSEALLCYLRQECPQVRIAGLRVLRA